MYKILYLFISLIFISQTNLTGQTLNPHSEEDLIEFSKIFSSSNNNYGFSKIDLPASYNLKMFTPPIVEQNGGSCVGHTVATSLSTTYNVVNKTSEFGRRQSHRFDPYYVYTALKQQNDVKCSIGCECGAYLWDGIELAIDFGIKKKFVEPKLECRDILTSQMLNGLSQKTSHYTIDDYYSLINYDENGKKTVWELDWIKEAIYFGLPPMVVIGVGSEFDRVTSSGLYQLPKSKENENGLHAVTLIGWNDSKNGGSFLFQNSYGTDWGDNGYFWLTYRDFNNNAYWGFIIDKEDYSDWKEDYRTNSYYKGGVYEKGVKKEGYSYEGEINKNTNLFNGKGILDTPTATAIGYYDEDHKDGWWLVCYDAYEKDGTRVPDPFYGWILFDQGVIIEKDSFGFTIGATNNKKTLIEELNLESYDLPISEEPATIDDFIQSDLDFFQQKLSAVE